MRVFIRRQKTYYLGQEDVLASRMMERNDNCLRSSLPSLFAVIESGKAFSISIHEKQIFQSFT
jgi:hypothetical protein